MRNICSVCTKQIMQMCRKGTGICGEICEKVKNAEGRRSNEIDRPNIEADRSEPEGSEPYSGGPELERSFARSAASEAAVGA